MRELIAACLAIAVWGQQPDAPAKEGWQPIFQKMADEYVIKSSGADQQVFELRPAPILRWSQPVRGGDDGATFAWFDRGRPAVIGAIFAYPNADGSRTVVHEFHALASRPFIATWGNKVNWEPKQGIILQEVPDAPAPADKPTARLAQMRSLLQQFTARSVDAKDRPWELRLMSQPLVRYSPEALPVESIPQPMSIIDGAVFAFAQGTDPEILIVLEAQRDAKGSAWKYGCGRFSDYKLELKHHDQIVWQVDQNSFSEQQGPYFAASAQVRQPPPGAKPLKLPETEDLK